MWLLVLGYSCVVFGKDVVAKRSRVLSTGKAIGKDVGSCQRVLSVLLVESLLGVAK